MTLCTRHSAVAMVNLPWFEQSTEVSDVRGKFFHKERPRMGDKGSKDKGKREGQKQSKLTAKEKRKKKRDRKELKSD